LEEKLRRAKLIKESLKREKDVQNRVDLMFYLIKRMKKEIEER